MTDEWVQCLAIIDSHLEDISEFINSHEEFTEANTTELNKEFKGLKASIELAQKLAPEPQKFSAKILLKHFFQLMTKTDGFSVLKKSAYEKKQWDVLGDIDEMRSLLKRMR